MSKAEQIDSLCSYHECDEKQRKLHYRVYVHEQWNPHPPARFVRWWENSGIKFTEQKTGRGWLGVPAVTAFNCEAARKAYREAKQLGLTDLEPADEQLANV